MKYKYEAFKDWKELFQWCADQKPIKYGEREKFYPSGDGSYYFTFQGELPSYKKAIPIREEEYSFNVKFYKSVNRLTIPVIEGGFVDKTWKLIKTEKFSTILEVEE